MSVEDPWLGEQWIPTTTDELPALERIRARHLGALAAFHTARRQVTAVLHRRDGADAAARERMLTAARAGEPIPAAEEPVSAMQHEVELQVAREREAAAMLALCDAVAWCLDQIQDGSRAELEAFVAERHQDAYDRRYPEAVRVEQLWIRLRAGGDLQIVDGLQRARAQAQATLRRAEIPRSRVPGCVFEEAA